MGPDMERSKPRSPNRIVSANLRRARIEAGWSQEEAGRRIKGFLGEEWSRALWSAAELAADPRRPVRRFDADLLVALARMFGKSLTWFLTPGEEDLSVEVGGRRFYRDEYLRSFLEEPRVRLEGEMNRFTSALSQVVLDHEARLRMALSRPARKGKGRT